MPLLNICAVTGNKKTIQVGLCFLSGEKERNYAWAMAAFRELMIKHGIREPTTIVTDRELALMNTLEDLFPESPHILCIWHVNMNILANCRKHFPKDTQVENKVIPNPKWELFLKDWNSLISSTTEMEYTTHLAEFRKHQKDAVAYAENTWIQPWKEKLVRFWVDMNLHFGVRFTSPIEGCHATLKAYLKVSTGDLKGVYDRLIHFWPNQHREIHNTTAQEQNKIKHSLNKGYFHMVQSLVHDRALSLILVECAKLHKAKEQHGNNLPPCNCSIKASMGLPCFHVISERLSSPGYILPEDIHPFWWYKRPELNTSSAIDKQTHQVVLNPAVVRGKGRPKGAKGKKAKGHGITATRRDPSQFEYILPSSAPTILNCGGTKQSTRQSVASILIEQARALMETVATRILIQIQI
jgi:hypothetical protein